jgi:hypothetical protein
MIDAVVKQHPSDSLVYQKLFLSRQAREVSFMSFNLSMLDLLKAQP